MKIICIIQARLGSTRLPEKVLLSLGDKTVLEQVVSRVRECRLINEVIVATTIEKQDLKIVNLCSGKGINVFCGSEDDVLDRYYQAAKLYKPDHVVRITSDCPFIDPDIMEKIIKFHIEKDCDYTSNTLEETYPDGLDVEVFKFSALEKSWSEAILKSEREHVTPFMKKHKEIFTLENIKCEYDYSSKRWTLDEDRDYDLILKIHNALFQENGIYKMNDILNFLKKNPDLENLNNNIIRNEGYLKSIEKDRMIEKE